MLCLASLTVYYPIFLPSVSETELNAYSISPATCYSYSAVFTCPVDLPRLVYLLCQRRRFSRRSVRRSKSIHSLSLLLGIAVCFSSIGAVPSMDSADTSLNQSSITACSGFDASSFMAASGFPMMAMQPFSGAMSAPQQRMWPSMASQRKHSRLNGPLVNQVNALMTEFQEQQERTQHIRASFLGLSPKQIYLTCLCLWPVGMKLGPEFLAQRAGAGGGKLTFPTARLSGSREAQASSLTSRVGVLSTLPTRCLGTMAGLQRPNL